MADEATDALIAQLMAADNPYFDDEYVDAAVIHDDSDEDYVYKPSRGRGRGNRGGRRGRPPAQRAADEAGTSSAPGGSGAPQSDDEGRVTASGRRRRKDAGQERAKGRAWSDEEERVFVQALESYGRDWKKCSEMLTTRDARAVASHAQKYFVKLCCQGRPLPAKVLEGGPGYTLSGKLLDPASASARAYGFRPELVKKLTGAELQTALSGLVVENLDLEAGALAAGLPLVPAGRPGGGAKRRRARSPGGGAADGAATASGSASDATAATDSGADGPTDYVRNRPRRQLAGSRLQLGMTSESLDLVQPAEFLGVPGSGAPQAQPFTVDISAEALLTMDFHSHLSSCEIIGLLGGAWDAARRHLSLTEAYPCRRAAGSADATSVELDPESQIEVTEALESKGQSCVGWYHSHPVFAPRPSQKDCDNQRNYQALFRDEASGAEPFVGVIMGPYDLHLPRPVTAVTVFLVQQRQRAAALTAYNVRYRTLSDASMLSADLAAKLRQAVELFTEDEARVELAEPWRPFTSLEANAPPCGPALRKVDKLAASVAYHCGHLEPAAVRAFLADALGYIEQSWGSEGLAGAAVGVVPSASQLQQPAPEQPPPSEVPP